MYYQEFDWEGRRYVRQGFMARVRIEEFGKGKIYPHEQTLSGPKADRLALTKACKMNLSPVFGLYPDPTGEANDELRGHHRRTTPLEATDHLGVVHRMWPVDQHRRDQCGPRYGSATADLHRRRAHRYETANTYRNWLKNRAIPRGESDPSNFVLMMLVGMSDPGLAILPTHRLVSGLPVLSAGELAHAFQATWPSKRWEPGTKRPKRPGTASSRDGGQNVFGFGTASDGGWLFPASPMPRRWAGWRPDQSDAWHELGVSLLTSWCWISAQGAVPASEPQFKYVHLLERGDRVPRRQACQLACLVPPARIEHVEAIASQFEKMPPKSTTSIRSSCPAWSSTR